MRLGGIVAVLILPTLLLLAIWNLKAVFIGLFVLCAIGLIVCLYKLGSLIEEGIRNK